MGVTGGTTEIEGVIEGSQVRVIDRGLALATMSLGMGSGGDGIGGRCLESRLQGLRGIIGSIGDLNASWVV